MRIRRYGSLRHDAASIRYEVALTGRPTGWSGDLDQIDELIRGLAPSGVVCTREIHGTSVWLGHRGDQRPVPGRSDP